MRGRSSKLETREGMEVDKLGGKQKEEPHLSGAYIRSLVKQLSSSRTKDPKNPEDQVTGDSDGSPGENTTKSGDTGSENLKNRRTPQPQQHKKQVRRRLHTNRPYQERLLNMAEARREIVTALKYHRAAMKQANEQQHQQKHNQQDYQQLPLPEQLSTPPRFEQEGKMRSRRNPRIYPSTTANFSSYLHTLSSNSFPSSPPPPSYPFPWHSSSILAPTVPENLNFPLPNQTLGLNLNFHDFNNIDTFLYQSSNDSLSGYSSSSQSPSSFPSLSIATKEFPSVARSREVPSPGVSDGNDSSGGGGFHQVMDDEEMAEIRSLGEQHQMEWNDTMNLVTSARWYKFLNTMELDPEVKAEHEEYQPFDQVMEFPAWMNENDGCLQQHLNDCCSQDYLHDPALPCMSIGEFDGMDCEWLA